MEGWGRFVSTVMSDRFPKGRIMVKEMIPYLGQKR